MKITVWLESGQADCWNITEGQVKKLRTLLPRDEIHHARSRDEFTASLPSTEAALTWFFEPSWADLAPKLRLIVTPAAGLDYFSTELPERIRIRNSHFHGQIISETVIGILLAHARGIGAGIEAMRREAWPRRRVTGAMRRLDGSHLVVLGFGHIGEWIARRAKGFGCRITGIRRQPARSTPAFFEAGDRIVPVTAMEEVLPEADFLVLALPRSPETNHILNAETLKLLPSHACVCNIGRGNAVDETALEDALRKRSIAAAYLDVFEEEPLPANSPLRALENCFLMPHSSAAAPDYLDLFIEEFAQWRGVEGG
jgi:phosphoglycerate dehydrogenase-like enzyme